VEITLTGAEQQTIEGISVRRINLPLMEPYRLSYKTFEAFEPIIVEVLGSSGQIGWADGHISPGSSDETRAGGWSFCQDIAPVLIGQSVNRAFDILKARNCESKVAATAISAALEMLAGSTILQIPEETRFPLLTPVNGLTADEIETEIAEKLAAGFKCFKVKVGKDVESDLVRLGFIQKAVSGRATLRIDANRAYNRDHGCQFAATLNPDGVELFEQPCSADDWEANSAVAAVSRVPLMLDEPICDLADIEHASAIEGVGFCKLKLKRFGSLAALDEGLSLVSDLGMEPVLGDGLGSEITSWMEACVARTRIRNAGEFNGFLKPRERLFLNPLRFEDGELILPAGFEPRLDQVRLEKLTLEKAEFGGK
jgi:L-alanine-DL-glutamate epimerase-like enolase superfamily enzyme